MASKSKHTGLGIALGAVLGAAAGVLAGHIAVWLGNWNCDWHGARRFVPEPTKRLSGVRGDASET
jgi:hypothetical protein